MDSQVSIEGLAKTYVARERRGLWRSRQREVHALAGVSFAIAPGEIFGLLGPNGAGKTTLIKCLTTLLLPTAGEVWINGFRLDRDESAIRASIGCMLMGERGLYWKLTGRENLTFFAALYFIAGRTRRDRVERLIEQYGLGDIADRAVETYSSGQRMKLAFARALINDAPLVVLDEPTNTLDVPSARELHATVRGLREAGKTIIYTTHIMAEAESLCDRVAIIDRGRLLALGTVDELKATLKRDAVLCIEGVIPQAAVDATRRLAGVKSAVLTAVNGYSALKLIADAERQLLPEIIGALLDQRAVIQQIKPEQTTLEDVFIAYTGRTLAERAEQP
ncbi:MAG TPA: ABC transporter ATP-binding protein [Thermoanaerobaculia bacterium]|nr:ABC transporter ATP-binding protein [Thermoanaerobaculia bacterium]